jgi:peroxiredoxin Q/BCP
MSAPQLGRAAPDFSLPDSSGGAFRLKDARGEIVVLYFYPRNNTPGCTLEGQQFQQLLPAFRRAGARIYGISRDSVASHRRFCEQQGFGFELLADEDETACRRYDVIREKHMYGRKHLGVERSTFLIDARGVLRQEWRKVRVDGHAKAVLEAVKAL